VAWNAITFAIDKENVGHCGQLADAAFNKIIARSQLSENRLIKPKYRNILKPTAIVIGKAKPAAMLPAGT
jgi:hypothetical protein